MLTRLKPFRGSYDRYGVFDIENNLYKNPITGKLEAKSAKDFKLGVALVDGEYHPYDNKEDMKAFLLDDDYLGYTWYGHNVSYDLSSFFDNILTIPDSQILMNGSRFIELKINMHPEKQKRRQNYNIKFWDTFNIIPLSLKSIGAAFNLPKLKMDVSNFEYCKRDVEITNLLLEKYFSYCREFNISARLTTSSTAMAIFRTNFLKNNVWIDNNDVFFKNSYIGGRTEVIKKVMKKGYHYDVNSLYPAAMSCDYYPDPSKIRKGTLNNFEYNLNNLEGVAEITIMSPDSHIPVLPYRDDGKVIYPVGTFRGWYNFNEIRFALNRGYKIITIHDYYFTNRIKSPFKEYIDFWFMKKSEFKYKDVGFYDFCKRMQNGLYGKFGEYHDDGKWGNMRDDPRTDNEIEAGLDIFSLYEFIERGKGYGEWIKKGQTIHDQKTEHTIFGWCSYVTSYARMILFEELEKSGLDTIAYMDTDSKFTPIRQESSNKLGEMKTEHEDIDCYFTAPKMYNIHQNIECRDYIQYVIDSIKDENKLKGVHLEGQSIFMKRYVNNRVIKPKEALRRDLEAGAWMRTIKEPTGQDTKRIWNKDGTSKPIRISP